MPRKPTAAQIEAAVPLSTIAAIAATSAGVDPIQICNVCGKPSPRLALWREHDERDKPTKKLVFIDEGDDDHIECRKAMEAHPRLYAEDAGLPGFFPTLCGPCRHRDGWRCRHPKLKANGGPGLLVKLDGMNGIVCGRGGCRSGITGARECEGRAITCEACKGTGRVERRADEYDVGTFGAVCLACRGKGWV